MPEYLFLLQVVVILHIFTFFTANQVKIYFYHQNILVKRTAYLAFISIFALSVFFYSLTPSFTSPQKRALRGILFLTLGISTGVPLLHLGLFPYYFILNFSETVRGFTESPPLFNFFVGGICYIFGAILYILRIPEKYRPGKHDIWGHSHQIFHFFVLLGVFFHYFGCLDAYYYRAENSCPMS